MGGYGVSWNDELDLDAETIWEDGILIEQTPESNINKLLAYQLLMARKSANVTQKQLAEITGIYQGDISKIERGIGNPSLMTLSRLAEGLEMQLDIKFVSRG
ncbi:MAG: helix-turn-helix transcriptional regulator [Lachnospiraceae bacterium]|nr:helix-turn-helix transcriptional regulator [Lachnospiraceae bacterium]